MRIYHINFEVLMKVLNSFAIMIAYREKYFVDLSELKRLVESVDLVESWGGIDDVKLYDLSHCKNRP
ncbi:hypothetical protein EA737_17460, partial [Acinetobacter baumannii]